MRKTIFGVVLGFSLLFNNSTADASVHYKDVKPSDNFYPAVENMIEQGAISSTLPYFHPYEKVTRGQASKMIAVAAGLDYKNVDDFANFRDVPSTHQFYPYIDVMFRELIIGGYNYYEFGVNEYLTRGQMARILVNAFKVPLLSISAHSNPLQFKDIYCNYKNVAEIYKQHGIEIMTLKQFNLLSGLSETEYGINKPVTRAQLVLLINQLQEQKDNYTNLRRLTFREYFNNWRNAEFTIEDQSIVKIVSYTSDQIKREYSYNYPPIPNQALLKPLKEGTTRIISTNGEAINVTVYEQDGVLRTSFEKITE